MSREQINEPHKTDVTLNRRTFSAAAAAVSVGAISASAVHAQDASPEAATPVSEPTTSVQMEVVASGLLDPRFIAIDGDTVYFTEAGTGGDTEVFENPGEGTPAPASPISMMGYTGKLSSIDASGNVTEIVSDFISYTFGANGEIVGAAGVALDGAGKAYVAVGSPGPYVGSMDLTGEEGALYEVDLATGEKRAVANLAEYEINVNPDPATVDSNVYGVAYREGVAYVVDAGGNSILAVDVHSGEITTFAVTGGLEAPFIPESGNPMRGGEQAIDSVPSGIALGPDDRLYVSYVTGGPFPAGFAPIDAFTIDGQQERVATGLTMLTDVAFGPDGHLYACVMTSDMINGGPGQIVRVMADGNHMVVVDGLQLPNGIAFDANGALYVTHVASMVPGGAGELLRITGVPESEGTPFVVPVAEG